MDQSKNVDNRTGLFARIPKPLKARFHAACGDLDQADVLTSILEFALPLIERVEPGKVIFKSLAAGSRRVDPGVGRAAHHERQEVSHKGKK